jgi:hypothetical protein
MTTPRQFAAPGVVRVALNVPTPISGISISESGVISGGGFALALAAAAEVPEAATGVIFAVTVADLQGLLSATGGGITGSRTKLTVVGSLSRVLPCSRPCTTSKRQPDRT